MQNLTDNGGSGRDDTTRAAGVFSEGTRDTGGRRIRAADPRIAYCGLDCGICEAYLATVRNDDALRASVAKRWSEWNHADITPEMINCTGCRAEGVKTPFCESMCAIRQCALKTDFETCGDCEKKTVCETLGFITDNTPSARKNLGM